MRTRGTSHDQIRVESTQKVPKLFWSSNDNAFNTFQQNKRCGATTVLKVRKKLRLATKMCNNRNNELCKMKMFKLVVFITKRFLYFILQCIQYL